MKKFVVAFILCFVSVVSFAQVVPVKIQKQTWHYIGFYLFVDNNKCYLEINSDNPYEDKIVKIYLGNRYNMVIKSLDNIIDGIKNSSEKVGAYFIVQGYRFNVWGSDNATITSSKLAYTAGTYDISIKILETAKENMKGWIDGEYYGGPSAYNETW